MITMIIHYNYYQINSNTCIHEAAYSELYIYYICKDTIFSFNSFRLIHSPFIIAIKPRLIANV